MSVKRNVTVPVGRSGTAMPFPVGSATGRVFEADWSQPFGKRCLSDLRDFSEAQVVYVPRRSC
jgi:hypothetical protein